MIKLSMMLNDLEDINSKINLILNNTPTKKFSNYKGQSFERKLLAVDVDYSLKQKAKIFLHGRTNYKLWFLNAANRLCLVVGNKIMNGELYLDIIIDIRNHHTQTRMSLDRFLYLIEIGDFRITNRNFIKYYLQPYQESNHVKNLINHLNSTKVKLEYMITNRILHIFNLI